MYSSTHLTQPVTKKVLFKGELFTGQDLNTYFGGIGQGVRPIGNLGGTVIDAEPISASGGWFAFTLGPWDKWSLNAGLGIDDVDSDDVNPGDRTRNRSIFGNALYAINRQPLAWTYPTGRRITAAWEIPMTYGCEPRSSTSSEHRQ